MQLTKHFSDHEFRCPCGECEPVLPPMALLILLETIRIYYNRPVYITSGHRCADYNAKVGGAPDSQHLTASAADFTLKKIEPKWVADRLERQPYANLLGIGWYSTHTHVDVRGHAARWGTNA